MAKQPVNPSKKVLDAFEEWIESILADKDPNNADPRTTLYRQECKGNLLKEIAKYDEPDGK